MPFVTVDRLRSRPARFVGTVKEAARHLLRKRDGLHVSLFISHSHHDRPLVEDIAKYLATFDVDVYVDWLDKDMLATTSFETAARLRSKIRSNQKFLLAASEHSLDSVWVPWELGYADGVKGESGNLIAALPLTAIDTERWSGNEYVGLYPQIRVVNGEDVVCKPGSSTGILLGRWLYEDTLSDRAERLSDDW